MMVSLLWSTLLHCLLVSHDGVAAVILRPRSPLSLGDTYASGLLRRCMENVIDEPTTSFLVSDVQRWSRLGHSTLTWGSGCSGTDMSAFAFDALTSVLSGFDIDVTFQHEFSAELETKKRDWILALHRPRLLFDDICKLYTHCCSTVHGERVHPIRDLTDIGIYMAGFVCKSVSNLNTAQSSQAGSACSSADTLTGFTFHATRIFMQRSRPKCVILENVKGIDRDQQLEHVIVWR